MDEEKSHILSKPKLNADRVPLEKTEAVFPVHPDFKGEKFLVFLAGETTAGFSKVNAL
ncbi:MAG: hypothetical protein HY579_13085 [Nitrospinae bacterium]|nr:hypothetical protein [Nitrospinota bacterium]